MDCPTDVFFTEAAFERYAVQPTLQELLEKYAPINTPPATGKQGKAPGKTDKGLENANKKRKGPYSDLVCSAKPEFRYPRYSSLMHSQQKKYLKLELKYSQHSLQGKHSAQELHELREFRQFQTQVNNEQREFQRHAEIVARKCPNDYGYLHPLAQVYIKRFLNKWCDRLKAHPQNYALYQTIGMGVEPVTPSDPVLKHLVCLITLGEATPMVLQPVDPHKPPILHHLVSVKDGANKEPQDDSIQTISEDENAKKLAAKYHANVVLSFVAMETLLDNHPPPVNFDQQWEIPITVSCHENEGNGQSAAVKTIYIDKPLKQKVVFPHEANAVFHKAALKQMLSIDCTSPIVVDSSDKIVDNYLQGGIDFCSSSPAEGGLDSLDFGAVSDADALIDLETFGSGLIFPLPKRVEQCKEKTKSDLKSVEKQNDANMDCGMLMESQSGDTSDLSNRALLYVQQKKGKQDALPPPEVITKTRSGQVGTVLTDEIRDSPLSPSSETEPNLLTDMGKETIQAEDTQDKYVPREIKGEHVKHCDASVSSLTSKEKVDDIQDSPTSPDPEPDISMSPLNSQCNDIKQCVPPGTVLSCKETQADEMKDGPTFVNVDYKAIETITDATSKTPLSPDSKSNSSEIQSDAIRDRPLPQEAKPVSKQKQTDAIKEMPSVQINNSSSENEGELIIASGVETDNEERLSIVINQSAKTKGDPTKSKKSKQLDTSMTSEDDSDGMMTRRRSALLRKADDSAEQLQSPAKKQKRADVVKGGGKECSPKVKVVGPVQDLARSIGDEKKSGAEVSDANRISVTGGKATDTCSNNTNVCDPNATQQSLNSNIASNSGNATATKLTSPSASIGKSKTNPIIKKPRTRNTSKTQAQKRGAKTGPMSSTIDTIMKLQEALHTRRKQRGPSDSSQGRSVENKVDRTQQCNVIEENPADYNIPKSGNVSYNLWRLGKMNILIRTRDDGVVIDNQQKFPVTVIPKMEYQTHFGYEQASVQELCRIWANLFAKPGSKVIRGRINAMSSELLKLEWLDLSSPLWINYPVNPARSMKMMHTMFEKLQGLPEGKYLLSHNPGDTHASVHLALEQGSKKRVTYDLHAAHNAAALQSGPPATLPWLPLDPKLPLCKHMEQGTIPLTFPPMPPGMKNRQHGPPPKKNKGKNKRGKNNNRP